MLGQGFPVLFCQELGFHYARSGFKQPILCKKPILAWNGHYGFRICTRSNGQKGCPGKTGVCAPILAEPVTGQPYGMLWQSKPPANCSGIADGKHCVLGAPMHMQCKETHKCRQNEISWVRVKFSKSPADSPETVDAPAWGLRATVRTRFLSRFLIWTKESKSGKSFWEKQIFRKEVPNMDCFARYRVAT